MDDDAFQRRIPRKGRHPIAIGFERSREIFIHGSKISPLRSK